MMPASVLTASRQQAAIRRLDGTGQIIPQIRADDDSGGSTITEGTPVNVNMGVASGMAGQNQLEQQILDRIGDRPYFFVILLANTAVSVDDEIQQLTPVSRRFHVLGIPNESISFEVLRRVVVVEE